MKSDVYAFNNQWYNFTI